MWWGLKSPKQGFSPQKTLGYPGSHLLSPLSDMPVALSGLFRLKFSSDGALSISLAFTVLFWGDNTVCWWISHPLAPWPICRRQLAPGSSSHPSSTHIHSSRGQLKWVDRLPSRTLASPLKHRYQILTGEIYLEISVIINFSEVGITLVNKDGFILISHDMIT